MRVIAGTYRSRILKSLKGLALRPTSDRLRETLFNVLAPNISGSRFADLFAGTGAIGIEALSRGAAEVVFIENHAPATALIRKNLDSLGIRAGFTVLPVDVLRGLEMLEPAGFEAAVAKVRQTPLDAPGYADALQAATRVGLASRALVFTYSQPNLFAKSKSISTLPANAGHVDWTGVTIGK